jgi:hypothetical protein
MMWHPDQKIVKMTLRHYFNVKNERRLLSRPGANIAYRISGLARVIQQMDLRLQPVRKMGQPTSLRHALISGVSWGPTR